MTHLGSFPHTFEDGPGNTASGVEVMDNLGFLKSGVDAVDDRVTTLSTDGPAAGTVGTTALATDAVTAAKIAADAVGSSEIAAGAVGASEIADGSIGAGELSDLLAGTAAPQVVSSLPGSPQNNQEVLYYPSAGIIWRLKYLGWLGAGWTTYGGWYCIGCIPLYASDDGLASKASATYANPASGTAMTLSLPMAGLYEVAIEATVTPPASAAAEAWISFKTSATAADDNNGAVMTADGGGAAASASVRKTSLIVVTAARTLTEQLRASTGTCTVTHRRMTAKPVIIG